MSIFESIVYGLVSGFAEFLPVSSQGHQALLMQMFGVGQREPIRDSMVHLGTLFALLVACKPLFTHMRREQNISVRRRRKSDAERRGLHELRLIKTASVPLVAGLLVYATTVRFEMEPLWLVLFFLLNGLILLVPEYMRHGNKDARFMTGMDGIFIGIFGALSALPGISRVSSMQAYTLGRGVDRQQALNWILLLSLPALGVLLCFDVVHLFSIGAGAVSFIHILGYLISGAMAYLGGYLGIITVRFLAVRTGFSGFAYYSFGSAIFSFVLYLIA